MSVKPSLGSVSLLALTCALALAGCGRAGESTLAADAAAPTSAPTAVEPATVDPLATTLADYEARARALSAQLATPGEVTAPSAEAEALLAQAATLVPAFSARHPQCAAYLDAALGIRANWRTLAPEVIERDYHDDGALPKVAENGAVCYHMKDLIVHPATVLALLAQPQPDFVQSKKEIDEVIAHLGAVRAALGGA